MVLNYKKLRERKENEERKKKEEEGKERKKINMFMYSLKKPQN